MTILHTALNRDPSVDAQNASVSSSLTKALEIYERLLSHIDDRPAQERAATICAISNGLPRSKANMLPLVSRRHAFVNKARF